MIEYSIDFEVDFDNFDFGIDLYFDFGIDLYFDFGFDLFDYYFD